MPLDRSMQRSLGFHLVMELERKSATILLLALGIICAVLFWWFMDVALDNKMRTFCWVRSSKADLGMQSLAD